MSNIFLKKNHLHIFLQNYYFEELELRVLFFTLFYVHMCVRLGAGNAEIPERILEPVVRGYIDELSVFFQ